MATALMSVPILFGTASAQLLTESSSPGQLRSMPGRIDNSGLRLLELADFNGDGETDLLGYDWHEDQVRISMGRGGGVFGPWRRVQWPVGGLPQTPGASVGDFDSDGHLDVLTVASASAFDLRIAHGDGQGGFPRATRLSIRSSRYSRPVAGDIDGDGDDDIVFLLDSDLIRLLNDGRGGLSLSRMPLATPQNNVPVGALLHDVDGDGDVDYLVGPRLLENTGGGAFVEKTAQNYPQGRPRAPYALGDLNGDGRTDLLSDLTVFLQDSMGRFTPAPLPTTARYARDGALLDIDGDGDLDVFASSGSRAPEIFLNDGSAQFSLQPDLGIDETDLVEAIDVDGDGDRDLVVGNAGGGRFRLFLNVGQPQLVDASPPSLGEFIGDSRLAAHADVDGDGDVDVIHHEHCRAVLFRNDGAGRLERDPAALPATCVRPGTLFGDFDGDGDPDLVTGRELYENTGAGAFRSRGQLPVPFALPTTFDFDGDGDLDIVGGEWLRNEGGFRFTRQAAPWTGMTVQGVVAADFNADGQNDVFVAVYKGQDRLFSGAGGGRFVDVTGSSLPGGASPSVYCQAVDLDQDGDRDLMVTHSANFRSEIQTRLLRNDGRGVFADDTVALLGHVPRGDLSFAADFDRDGDIDLLVTGETMEFFEQTSAGFIDRSSEWTDERFGIAAAVADLDEDGDPDVLIRPGLYVPAKVLSNHHRQLHAPQVGRRGADVLLDAYGQPGEIVAAVLALQLLPRRRATPFGSLGIDVVGSALLPVLTIGSPGVPVSWRIRVPTTPALVGRSVFAQALYIDPFSNGRLSNVQRISVRE